MKQYLLSIYQPDGEPPPPELLAKVMRDVNALVDETKAAGVWVFNGGLHPPSTATVVRVQRGDVLITDGPFAEGEGTHRRLHDYQGAGSRCGARMGAQDCASAHAPWRAKAGSRSRSGPSRERCELGDRACISRGVRPRRGRPGPPLRRHRRRRGGGSGRVHRRHRSGGRPTACRRARRDGSSPRLVAAPSTVSDARRRARIVTPRRHPAPWAIDEPVEEGPCATTGCA